jgi:hypothetical protein
MGTPSALEKTYRLLCKCYVEDENIRPILADETSSGSRSNLVAIIAGIDLCDIGHEFWVRAVFQIQGWHLELIGITSPVLHKAAPMGQAKGFPTARLGNCMTVILPLARMQL